MISSSEDEVHYSAIRKALTNGNAAVMVGSGFSRNAENGDQLATWPDVAKALWSELYPDSPALTDFSSSTVTQLGEQYSRVFSKPALEDLLKRLIPDERVRPGALHNKLLELNWSEVFTTNYDTLIERAAEGVVQHAHYTVMCQEDIPQSKILNRRRIVKLHGSFPSQRPFIFTEDDYRKYPQDSAPFINLVRQSLLENVFCLIGFSGDDPNFLNWIGWVRDMLDKHALPIYLFLTSQPSLGQRKILESRQITPVILPLPQHVDSKDYNARYTALLNTLSKADIDEESEWAKNFSINPTSDANKDLETQISDTIKRFSVISHKHKTCPDWMIIPASIRNKIRSGAEGAVENLHKKSIREHFEKSEHILGTLVIAEYCWLEEVRLQSLDDNIAKLGLWLFDRTKNLSDSKWNQQLQDAQRLGVFSKLDFRIKWRNLGLSLLRWARQALNKEDFSNIKKTLVDTLPKDLLIQDEISYEHILLSIYEGNRDIAENLLRSWDIISSEHYMWIRKGALLAELGHVESGLAVALKGLEQLRANQKVQPSTMRYISQEAWACLIAERLQRHIAWSARWNTKEKQKEKEINELESIENYSRRLNDLSIKGYDVKRELHHLIADLNAETPSLYRRTTQVAKFDLGAYATTNHLGFSSDLSNKVTSAFSWLTTVDRVGLSPRIMNTTYDLNTYAQAAWWIQHNDSIRRVLSVIGRTLSTDLTKDRNPNKLRHETGWLSRFQVAQIDQSLAQELCQDSLSLIERTITTHSKDNKSNRVIRYNLEILSRLAIRINDQDLASNFIERLLVLHQALLSSENLELWDELSTATARCFESISIELRASLVPKLLDISIQFQRETKSKRSGNSALYKFSNRSETTPPSFKSKTLSNQINSIIKELSTLEINKPDNAILVEELMQSLFFLKSWGALTATQNKLISRHLESGENWPTFQNHHPWSALSWLDSDNDKKTFIKWILQQKIERIVKVSTSTDDKQSPTKSFHLNAKNTFLQNWLYSQEHCEWSLSDINTGLASIKDWFTEEWPDLQTNIQLKDNLAQSIRSRLGLIDSVLANIQLSNNTILSSAENSFWIESLISNAKAADAQFWKLRLTSALQKSRIEDIQLIQHELIACFADSNISEARRAYSTIEHWTKHADLDDAFRPRFIISALITACLTLRSPTLSWTLRSLSEISSKQPSWVSIEDLNFLNIGLQKLIGDLTYEKKPSDNWLADESIPTLRFHSVKLAISIKESFNGINLEGVDYWASQSNCDPLPEVRYANMK